jgi:predicted ATPase
MGAEAQPITPAERRLNRAKNALWSCLKRIQPGYEKDLHNLDALNGLSHWLVGETYGTLVKGKGIFLQGPVGTGKTDLMQALSAACVMGGGTSFAVVGAKRIEKEVNRSDDGSRDRSRIGGDHVILQYANMEHLCIDDIGMELDIDARYDPAALVSRVRTAVTTYTARLPVAGHRCCHPHCIAATPLLRDGSALS